MTKPGLVPHLENCSYSTGTHMGVWGLPHCWVALLLTNSHFTASSTDLTCKLTSQIIIYNIKTHPQSADVPKYAIKRFSCQTDTFCGNLRFWTQNVLSKVWLICPYKHLWEISVRASKHCTCKKEFGSIRSQLLYWLRGWERQPARLLEWFVYLADGFIQGDLQRPAVQRQN